MVYFYRILDLPATDFEADKADAWESVFAFAVRYKCSRNHAGKLADRAARMFAHSQDWGGTWRGALI